MVYRKIQTWEPHCKAAPTAALQRGQKATALSREDSTIMFLPEVSEAAAGINPSSMARALTELKDSRKEQRGSEKEPMH